MVSTDTGRMAARAALGILLACGLAAAPADAKPFRMSVSGDANTMDPHSQNAGNVTLLLRQIYEPLIARGKELQLEPGLATSWQQVEPLRWRFTLRANVRFSTPTTSSIRSSARCTSIRNTASTPTRSRRRSRSTT